MDNVVKFVCVGVVCLLAGFGIGYISQPEPKVEIKPMLKPPFVEVRINGRIYDTNHLKVVPEPAPKKGWWGEGVQKTAMSDGQECNCTNCECVNCDCTKGTMILAMAAGVQGPASGNAGDKGGKDDPQFLGGIFKDAVRELLNWFSPRYDDAAKALAERERTVTNALGWIGAALAAGFLLTVIPLWSIAISQAKIAGR